MKAPRWFGGILALALVISGCASGTDEPGGDTTAQETGGIGLQEGMVRDDTGGKPVAGGSVNVGTFAEPRSLDPAVTSSFLTTSGMELLHIYDTLMRYDAESGEFEPHMAASLEPNEDFTEWTLQLQPDLEFSDGQPLKAAAVVASHERYIAAPGPDASLWIDNVTQFVADDDLTVTYQLARPWPYFPIMLASGPGMIVAPGVGADESFTPVGAGPFVFESWRPQEEIVLSANPNYWDGPPHLESVRFAYLPDARAAVEAMESGTIDLTFVRDPDQVDEVLATEPNGYVNMTAAQNAAIINASEGRPGADVRVRRAMQLAIDTDGMQRRLFNGADGGSSTLFPEYSRWGSDTEGLPYDPEEAKRLLEEAKADGFDGRIEYVETSDPPSRELALAVQGQLEAVGFEVEVRLLRSVADLLTTIAVNQDYDVAVWGYSFREADPYPKMFATMHSSGNQRYGAHSSPEMDALLEEFQVASDEQSKVDVMDRIQQQINQDVPFLVYGPYAEIVIWTDAVHGVVGTANSMVMLGGAWKE